MSTGQRCACGQELPPAWPRGDAWGRAICNGCWDHEKASTWPEPGTAGPELALSIARPQGGAYGREGER